jgi:hypothetical protein
MRAAKYVGETPSTVRIGAAAVMPGQVISEPKNLVDKLLRYPDFEEVDVGAAGVKPAPQKSSRKKARGSSSMDSASNEEPKKKSHNLAGEES